MFANFNSVETAWKGFLKQICDSKPVATGPRFDDVTFNAVASSYVTNFFPKQSRNR